MLVEADKAVQYCFKSNTVHLNVSQSVTVKAEKVVQYNFRSNTMYLIINRSVKPHQQSLI